MQVTLGASGHIRVGLIAVPVADLLTTVLPAGWRTAAHGWRRYAEIGLGILIFLSVCLTPAAILGVISLNSLEVNNPEFLVYFGGILLGGWIWPRLRRRLDQRTDTATGDN